MAQPVMCMHKCKDKHAGLLASGIFHYSCHYTLHKRKYVLGNNLTSQVLFLAHKSYNSYNAITITLVKARL